MPHPRILLHPGKEESLKRFHPWVFSGAIRETEGDPQEGDVVEVYTSRGEYCATGHFQRSSIAVRVFSFDPVQPDGAFWTSRLKEAFDLRRRLGLMRPDNNAFRLVYGEGDSLPGLVVDVYGRTAVLQCHSVGMFRLRQVLADSLIQATDGWITDVYNKSDATLPKSPKVGQDGVLSRVKTDGYLRGGENVVSEALENGLRFHVDWLKGQKTGFFVDQRDNRLLLERYAEGREVLNMCSYTGGFSVYALRGGAAKVHSVDVSSLATDLTRRNVELNFPGDARHEVFVSDAFDYLSKMPKDTYDLIVLDPPAFAKHHTDVRNALQGYKKLNVKAFEKIRPGGVLFTFSCSQAVSREQFRLAVFSAAAISGRRVRILHQMTQGADHPVNIYHPEGEYLKGLVLYVE